MKRYYILYLLCLGLIRPSYADLYESLLTCKIPSVAEQYVPSRSLKILICVRTFPKLSETFVLNQILGLLELGHDITIYAERTEHSSKVHEAIVKHKLLDKTIYKELPKDIADYDIIIGEFGPLGVKMLSIKKEHNLRAKLITFFRGFDITSYLAKKPHVYDEFFVEGDFFLTNCEHFKQRMIDLGVAPDRILVSYSSINCNQFIYQEREHRPAINLLTTGRLVEKKGITYVFDALVSLKEQYPKLRYHIAGNGPLYKTLKQQVQQKELSDIVTFSGSYNLEELPAILADANIYLCPSATASSQDQDAIPNTLKEAMATGLPVIATRHGGIPEIIEHRANGLLIDEKKEER